jgi:hypothetical protein
VKVVHVLDHGWPLCMFTEHLPCDWPRGHVWVSVLDVALAGEDVCADCVREHERIKAQKSGRAIACPRAN